MNVGRYNTIPKRIDWLRVLEPGSDRFAIALNRHELGRPDLRDGQPK